MSGPEAIVVGCSMGGFSALCTLLEGLDRRLSAGVVVCSHAGNDNDVVLVSHLLAAHCALPVIEAQERHPVRPGHVHVAPGGYHLLLEPDRHFALSVDPFVRYSRPSIDVLFGCAAEAYGTSCAGIMLTGANADGAEGLRQIRAMGGIAIVQNPASAEAPAMPQAALDVAGADYCLELAQIPPLLNRLCLT